MDETPLSNPTFNAAGGSNAHTRNIAALVVDVQLGCIKHMPREDARAYLSALGETIEDLRARNIPVKWIAISNKNELHPAQNTEAGNEPRSQEDLEKIGFYGVDPRNEGNMDEENKDIFDDFIAAHGPRLNETCLSKTGFSAFETDLLATHLKDTHVNKAVIIGAVGSQCCLETGIDSVQNNIETSYLVDRVVNWIGEGVKSPLTWRENFENPEDANNWHRSELKSALPRPSRGFTPEQIAAGEKIDLTTSAEFLEKFRSNEARPAPAIPVKFTP